MTRHFKIEPPPPYHWDRHRAESDDLLLHVGLEQPKHPGYQWHRESLTLREAAELGKLTYTRNNIGYVTSISIFDDTLTFSPETAACTNMRTPPKLKRVKPYGSLLPV